MRRLLGLLALVGGASFLVMCGPEPKGAGMPLDLYVSRSYVSRLASFQASLVSRGDELSQDQVESRCIVDQVSADRFVLQEDSNGQLKKAVLIPNGLSTNSQQFTLKGITPGKNYRLVIEAVSKDDPPQFLASGTYLIDQLKEGPNTLPAAITLHGVDGGTAITDGGAASIACDPRIEK